MKNLKTNWLIKHSLTVLSCVLIIVLGIAAISYADPVITSIGENIITNILTATGLTVNGNATTTGNQIVSGNLEVSGNATTTGNQVVSGNLDVAGNTTLTTTTMATTTISALSLSSINGNIKYVKPGETIQSVIGSIGDASASNPYVVKVPPGVYTEQITMKNYVSLQGSGKDSTIINYPNAILINNEITAVISNLTAKNFTENNAGICLGTNFSGLINIYNCNIEKTSGIFRGALYLENTNANGIINCYNSKIDGLETKCGAFAGQYNLYNCEIESNSACILWQSGTTGSIGRVFGCYIHGVRTETAIVGVQAGHWDYSLPLPVLEIFDSLIDVSAENVDALGIVVGGCGEAANLSVYGGSIRTNSNANSTDLKNFEQIGTFNVYGTKYNTSSGIITGKHDAEDETATGVYTLNPSGVTKIDSSGGVVTGTLPDGHYIGQRKHIVMTNAAVSSTVTVTHLATGDGGDGEVGIFDAVGEVWILEWSGTEWVTIKAMCTFV